MKLTERKLRGIIREEISRLVESPQEQERIYNEIVDYLDRNGRKSGNGWDIGNIHVTIERGNGIEVNWHNGRGQRPLGDVKIGPNGELSHVGAGGATPMSMPDYYTNPEDIIELLQGDKRTVSNYPT